MGSRRHQWGIRTGLVTAALVVATTGCALGAGNLVAPGTAAQVAALVAASPTITTLPQKTVPSLADAPNDYVGSYMKELGGTCRSLLPTCAFGDLTSTRTMVLLGDSHALMWLPALVPLALKLHERLDLFWNSGCPLPTLLPQNPTAAQQNCASWKVTGETWVRAHHPVQVILAERSSVTSYFTAAPGVPFTSTQWISGLETTLRAFSVKGTHVVLIGDVPVNNNAMPNCLAIHPTAVQSCGTAVQNPVATNATRDDQEASAAAAVGVGFVNPLPWLCTHAGTCSPIVGNMITYYDGDHVSATYAAFLATVMGAAVVKAAA
jgi:SGNH domain (fused to AT3 domains)